MADHVYGHSSGQWQLDGQSDHGQLLVWYSFSALDSESAHYLLAMVARQRASPENAKHPIKSPKSPKRESQPVRNIQIFRPTTGSLEIAYITIRTYIL